jgi:catechol 2,3-dioxygenase-like lactoylglutathione lyase family enzyme
MKVHRIEHIGIVVNDLDAAKAFFLDLGLEVEGETEVEGELVDRLIGLKNAKSTVVQLGTPTGEAKLELAKFHRPLDEAGVQPPPASNTLGIRHILFLVEDLEAIVAKLQAKGTKLVGEIQTYENTYKLCYLRGPEGIIIELAEELK